MFENINLKEELIKERKSEHSINSLINELNTILKDDSKLEEKDHQSTQLQQRKHP